MSATATMNGKPAVRKQLGDQLDRLDSIIDALAEGLPGAVADACREGARQAVKDAIIEIISNPELRTMLTPMRPEPAPIVLTPTPNPNSSPEVIPESKPGLFTRLKTKVAAVRKTLSGAATTAKEAVTTRCKSTSETICAVGKATGERFPVRRVLLVGLGVGLAVGLVSLLMPQAAVAVVSAVSVAATAVAVQTGSWLKRAARRFGLVT